MSVSKDDFCQIICVAYEIQDRHPDWDMDKCIEYAVKYAYVPSCDCGDKSLFASSTEKGENP